MAFGWLSLLKSVPWAGVISTAPLVADGARQLWKAVSKTNPLPEPGPAATPHPASGEAGSITVFEARIATLETSVDDLHAQMLKSSELIRELADQNAQLVKRVEANRVRTMWLTGLVIVAAALAGLAFLIIR